MENAIEYFENQEDALEFAKCLDCVNYLVSKNIIDMDRVRAKLYNSLWDKTKNKLTDTNKRIEIFEEMME
jgi:hypothetical protein